MLSILIPTYNYNIRNLVESVLSQSEDIEAPIEIRIYEDGSTINSEENKKLQNSERIIYKHFQENRGRTAIRSLMAEEAKYDWLLFLDADVIPAEENFLKTYIQTISEDWDVIFGGISYREQVPAADQILRWKYGKEREAKSVSEREKSPYFIISQNLLIRKEVFLAANDLQQNLYGLDNYFSYRLLRLKSRVKHIDNPVIHLGLESSSAFLRKALEAVKTTVILENKQLMADDMRPIQQSFLKLKRSGLSGLFASVISALRPVFEKNFRSQNPNLFWFDLYRLAYYIQLKKKKNV